MDIIEIFGVPLGNITEIFNSIVLLGFFIIFCRFILKMEKYPTKSSYFLFKDDEGGLVILNNSFVNARIKNIYISSFITNENMVTKIEEENDTVLVRKKKLDTYFARLDFNGRFIFNSLSINDRTKLVMHYDNILEPEKYISILTNEDLKLLRKQVGVRNINRFPNATIYITIEDQFGMRTVDGNIVNYL